MKQKMYQVDAFTDKVFGGNPAAVCPLDAWLPAALLQQIAMENNLAETAFYVKENDRYEIRWFTPAVEVDLCGHATLAAAYVLFNHEHHGEDVIHFHSPRSGPLTVAKKGELLTLNFPTDIIEEVTITTAMLNCFNHQPSAAFKGKSDYLFIFETEAEIQNAIPVYEAINKLEARGVIISAKGESVDFVSRFFAPQSGINEDPVTGSAHTSLIPYWAERLHKTELTARQLSARGGHLFCKYLQDRVEISGHAQLYMIGEIFLP